MSRLPNPAAPTPTAATRDRVVHAEEMHATVADAIPNAATLRQEVREHESEDAARRARDDMRDSGRSLVHAVKHLVTTTRVWAGIAWRQSKVIHRLRGRVARVPLVSPPRAARQ